MIKLLHEYVQKIFSEKRADILIGFEKYHDKTRPIFITDAGDINKLTVDFECKINLVTYLLRGELKPYAKIAIIARIPELKAIAVLTQENQLKEDNIVIIGIMPKDNGFELVEKVKISDYLDIIKKWDEDNKLRSQELDKKIQEIEKMPPHERFLFWRKELEKCIKCYACRQSCPVCYCTECIVEKNNPQWIETSAHTRGNFAWNIIRAFHEAGRCVECGACENACPVGIQLMLLNRKIINDVKEYFGYEAGHSISDKPVMSNFCLTDKEEFIL